MQRTVLRYRQTSRSHRAARTLGCCEGTAQRIHLQPGYLELGQLSGGLVAAHLGTPRFAGIHRVIAALTAGSKQFLHAHPIIRR